MTNPIPNETAPQAQPGKGMKLQIWIMLLMVGGVMLMGILLVPRSEEQRQRMIEWLGTTNQGELVSPAFEMAPLLPPQDDTKNAKWRVVIVDSGQCESACQQMLYETRQVHVRLGREATRIQRLLLSEALPQARLDELKEAHPYLLPAELDRAALTELMQDGSAAWPMLEPRFFVVNPSGQAILYYTPSHHGDDLLEDLKHLLKYSPDR